MAFLRPRGLEDTESDTVVCTGHFGVAVMVMETLLKSTCLTALGHKLLPCRGLENLRFCGVPPPDFDEGCTVSVEDFVDVGSSLSFRSCTRMSA